MPASHGLANFATATSWVLSPPRPTGVLNTSARSQSSSPGGPSSTCGRTRAAPSTRFACSSHQLSYLAHAESFAGVPTTEGNTRAKRSSSIAWKRASPRGLRPPTRLSKMACSSAFAGPFAVGFAASSPIHAHWGFYLCNRMPHSRLDMKTLFKRLYGKEVNLSHLKIIGARAFVHIKDAKKLEPKWLQRGRSALLPALEPETSQGGGEQERDVHRDSATSYSATYTILSAPGVATSVNGRRLRFNRRSAARWARDYIAGLDSNVNIPPEHANADSVDGGPGNPQK